MSIEVYQCATSTNTNVITNGFLGVPVPASFYTFAPPELPEYLISVGTVVAIDNLENVFFDNTGLSTQIIPSITEEGKQRASMFFTNEFLFDVDPTIRIYSGVNFLGTLKPDFTLNANIAFSCDFVRGFVKDLRMTVQIPEPFGKDGALFSIKALFFTKPS
jgi:hypothetical protein